MKLAKPHKQVEIATVTRYGWASFGVVYNNMNNTILKMFMFDKLGDGFFF